MVVNEEFVDIEISRLAQSGAIHQCHGWTPKCILSLHTVPKNGKLRLVLDCHHTNKFIRTPKFNQEGIKSVEDRILEDDVLISVDLENGFHHVQIHISYAKYFLVYFGRENTMYGLCFPLESVTHRMCLIKSYDQ